MHGGGERADETLGAMAWPAHACFGTRTRETKNREATPTPTTHATARLSIANVVDYLFILPPAGRGGAFPPRSPIRIQQHHALPPLSSVLQPRWNDGASAMVALRSPRFKKNLRGAKRSSQPLNFKGGGSWRTDSGSRQRMCGGKKWREQSSDATLSARECRQGGLRSPTLGSVVFRQLNHAVPLLGEWRFWDSPTLECEPMLL